MTRVNSIWKRSPFLNFKVSCLSILERVRKTRKPVFITRFGEPVAEVVPPRLPERPSTWLGALAGTGRIEGDIVAPAVDEGDWDVVHG